MAFPYSSDTVVNSIHGNIAADTPTSNVYGTTAHHSDVGVGIANSPMGAAPTAINGNADTAPIKTEDDKQRATALIEAMTRNIARMSPKAAEGLPHVSNLMSASELEKIRFDVAKIEYELAAKENMEVAQGLVGGVVLAGAGGAALASGAATPFAPFAMADSGSKDKAADRASHNVFPINKEFERLLAGLEKPVMPPGVSDARHADITSLGGVSVGKELPDLLKVAEKTAAEVSTGRVRSLKTT